LFIICLNACFFAMIATIDQGQRDLQQLAWQYEEKLRRFEARKGQEIEFLASQAAAAEHSLREVRGRHEAEIRRLTNQLGEERRQATAERYHASSLEASFEQLRQDRRKQLAEGDTASAELDVARSEIVQLRQHIEMLTHQLGARQLASTELVGEIHRLQQQHLQQLQQQSQQLQEQQVHEHHLQQASLGTAAAPRSPRSHRRGHHSHSVSHLESRGDPQSTLSGAPGAGVFSLDEAFQQSLSPFGGEGGATPSMERRRKSSKDNVSLRRNSKENLPSRTPSKEDFATFGSSAAIGFAPTHASGSPSSHPPSRGARSGHHSSH